MSEGESAPLRSAQTGEAELIDASLEVGSAFDERDMKKRSVDIRLFWGARHQTRRKKSVTGR